MVRIVSVSDLYFGGRKIDINCGCDGIPCTEYNYVEPVEPSDEELEKIELAGKSEGLPTEVLKASFQNVLISTTFKIK